MKYYGYKNDKINRLLGDTTHGEWVRISFFRYMILRLFGYMHKTERE
ncbi:MAG: hypothetical protein GY853_10120 [PVC group bacterium]|nr:hypothetical protein [PVC group bacterium]